MEWNLLHFSDLQAKTVPAQLAAYASAYLDSARVLCEKICFDDQPVNYAHGAVVMSLTFHSLELFFKGAIIKLSPEEKFGGKAGHDLDSLARRFFKLYPKKEFEFEVPFRREFPSTIGEMTPKALAAYREYVNEHNRRAPEDQRHRYPTGIDGKSWDGAFGFEPNVFLSKIKELQLTFARVIPLLNAV
jgi:hypothetical protein